MRVLVTGGAGYIGAHTAIALLEAGHEVLIVDDLSRSRAVALERIERISGRSVPALVADLRDEAALTDFLTEHAPVDAVVHLAGVKAVGESIAEPLRYYDTIVGTSIALLKVMAKLNIFTLIFSSSATVYGTPDRLPLREDAPTGINLANPYGKTKRVIEEILTDAAAAEPALRIVSLRYFNPIGAHESGHIGEDPLGTPNNLMPLVARVALGLQPMVTVFGDDYDTPDGTGLRDYIHVVDLAAGHVAALAMARPGHAVYNLGTGRPVSVLELIDEFERVSGRTIPREVLPRRRGDVASSYADPTKAERELGWKAVLSLADACRDHWNWQTHNPNGYT